MFVLKNRNDPELREANFHTRLSHSKQLLKYSTNDIGITLLTDEKIFAVTTTNKNSS